MKKITLFLAVITVFALISCGSDTTTDTSSNNDVKSDVVENNDVNTSDIAEEIDWEGIYTYEEEAGGDRYYIYTLNVFLADGYYQAFYSIDGYQTMTRLNLYCEEEGGVLYMYFEDYGKEDMFQNGYNVDDLTLTLSYSYDNVYILNDGTEMEFIRE